MKKVLIVDDDEGIIESLSAALEIEGYETATLTSGDTIRKKIIAFQPDLILLDLLLSGHDGGEIVVDLKKTPETAQIPIVILSAHPTAEKKAREAGADSFLPKPFELTNLYAVIKKLIK